MKKELQLQPNEPLHDWVNRLADQFALSGKQLEAIHEVSKQSYIKGTQAAFGATETVQLRYTIEYADNGIIIRDPNLPYTEVAAFGEDWGIEPCAIALGKMLYEDIEEAEKNFDEYIGYKLIVNIEPLKIQDNG